MEVFKFFLNLIDVSIDRLLWFTFFFKEALALAFVKLDIFLRRSFKLVFDDRFTIFVDGYVLELAKLLLNHTEVIFGIGVQNAFFAGIVQV